MLTSTNLPNECVCLKKWGEVQTIGRQKSNWTALVHGLWRSVWVEAETPHAGHRSGHEPREGGCHPRVEPILQNRTNGTLLQDKTQSTTWHLGQFLGLETSRRLQCGAHLLFLTYPIIFGGFLPKFFFPSKSLSKLRTKPPWGISQRNVSIERQKRHTNSFLPKALGL